MQLVACIKKTDDETGDQICPTKTETIAFVSHTFERASSTFQSIISIGHPRSISSPFHRPFQSVYVDVERIIVVRSPRRMHNFELVPYPLLEEKEKSARLARNVEHRVGRQG